MTNSVYGKGLLFLMIFLMPFFAFSQGSKSIFFSEGKSSITTNGTVKGRQYIDYKLSVLAGQTLKVSINAKSTSVNFNILPPGSSDVAIFNSSMDGLSYSGIAEKSGLYAIRVYLMGAAESENRSVNFALSVGLIKSKTPQDAKVKGTDFNATGQLHSSKGKSTPGSVMSNFGVKRLSSGDADVYVTYPGSSQKILRFSKGEWTCLSANCTVTFTRSSTDEWSVSINGMYHFFVPDAVINGG